MQIWKTERRFAKRNANLENRAQICKTKRKSGKPNADLQNEMQIWKTERRFAKRNANLENRAQICKTKCKSGKPSADLQNEMQIWKTECRFAKRNANLENRMQICKAKCRSAKFDRNLSEEIQRLEDLADIEGPGRWKRGDHNARIGFPLFFEELDQHGFGVHANEFLSQEAMEQVDIAGMDAVTVVDHGEMIDAFPFQAIDRQHHVGGILRMNEMG